MDSFLRMHFLNLLALDFAVSETPSIRCLLPELVGQGTWPEMRKEFAHG